MLNDCISSVQHLANDAFTMHCVDGTEEGLRARLQATEQVLVRLPKNGARLPAGVRMRLGTGNVEQMACRSWAQVVLWSEQQRLWSKSARTTGPRIMHKHAQQLVNMIGWNSALFGNCLWALQLFGFAGQKMLSQLGIVAIMLSLLTVLSMSRAMWVSRMELLSLHALCRSTPCRWLQQRSGTWSASAR